MPQVEEIKEEHIILKNKIVDLEKVIQSKKGRDTIEILFDDFESFWKQHELKEEKFFNEYEKSSSSFPFTKMLVSEHRELKGHWHVLKDFIKNRSDKELSIALETDGQMILDKFKNHIEKEDKYLDKQFN